MPIYEYACTKCGHEFETLQRISEDPLKKCPTCQKMSLIKKVSAAAFVLKGTGWYETDFKDKKKVAGDDKGDSDTAADKKTESASDSASTDVKTATAEKKSDAEKPATTAKAKDDKKTPATKKTPSKTS